MPLIDHTFFVGKLNLPQTGDSTGRAKVMQYVEIYEPELLKKALGYDLWKAFTDEVGGSPGSPGDIAERWDYLLYGADYTYKNRAGRWQGFIPEGSVISPIANYVFYQLVADNVYNVVQIGTVTSETDNNRNVNPVDKLVDCHNSMVDMLRELFRFLQSNTDLYPEWKASRITGYTSVRFDWWEPYSYAAYCRNDVYNKINSLDL